MGRLRTIARALRHQGLARTQLRQAVQSGGFQSENLHDVMILDVGQLDVNTLHGDMTCVLDAAVLDHAILG